MHARFVTARLLRVLGAPLALALPPLFWVVDAIQRESVTTLGRDQGIFQYVAWAIAQGDVDYRDIRDVNGPLTHVVHRVLLALGGGDEHTFRSLDLAVSGAVFAIVGACLPGLRRKSAHLERWAWALAGWVVLSGQYLLYGWWDSAQRESFFDWFLLPSVAVQLLAQRAPFGRATARGSERRSSVLWLICGSLSVAPWFGKPTFALFSALQVGTLLVDPAYGFGPAGRRALRAFAAGGALASAALLGFLVASGDVLAYLRVQIVDVPAMYRFIWPRAAADILAVPFYSRHAIHALCGAAVITALVVAGELPVAAIVVGLLPLVALGNVLLQAKGFLYHFHPVTAGVYLQWLVLVVWVSERARVAQQRLSFVRVAPVAASALVALQVATFLQDSPSLRDPWLLWGGRDAESRASAAFFAHFVRSDYFPDEMREAAAYLREHTVTDGRVQTYGMDPYLLFLARRRSATPCV